MDSLPVKTTCPYCGVGCGVIARPQPDGSVEIAGDPDHPANFGRLCSKGSALGETLSLSDRLLYPNVHSKRTSWDEALGLVARRFSETIQNYGPDSVALYVSGQLLTEDYYVANKFMKGFVGSANIDTNSRLCMASSVAGHKRAFGSDTVPGIYEDLELADLVVLVGSNLAWCHPVLAQRLQAARDNHGTKIVVIDPRMTATCEFADMHLSLSPGSDVAIFNGLLAEIAAKDAVNQDYVESYTAGFGEALAAASNLSLAEVAMRCGLSREQLQAFYDLFISQDRVVTVYSQGVNQSTSGTDKVNAILNCHLATGRIGRPGMGPFSVTGQPNAMGGREVGGLANMLAAHMEIANEEHRNIVKRFWKAPVIADKPGLKAVDLFQAVAEGSVKAIWIMGTNPVVSAPDANHVRSALEKCPFVVVSDVAATTDTMLCADVLLPALTWGEKSGTVTNSERRISRQRAFLPGPGEAAADWWQVAQVAQKMGFFTDFDYGSPHEIFAEHAALSGIDNTGNRDFDISAWSDTSTNEYDEMEPFLWPQPSDAPGQEHRFFAKGNFFTPSGKANFIAVEDQQPASAPNEKLPFVLNTGRIRDQWHTMTRTSKSPRLMSHIGEPFVEIHPADASDIGLSDATLAHVENERASAILRVHITGGVRRGNVFAPMHWTSEHASCARIDALAASNVDPYSGQPELKYTPVKITPYEPACYGFAVTAAKPDGAVFDYWARANTKHGWRMEFAFHAAQNDWLAIAADLFAVDDDRDILTCQDPKSGRYQYAAFSNDRLIGALWASPDPVAVGRSWAAGCLAQSYPDATSRLRLLAGRAATNERDPGPIVCSCFDVGSNEIAAAVIKHGCSSVSGVGAQVQAGTNCGSCRPEISRIIHENRVQKAS